MRTSLLASSTMQRGCATVINFGAVLALLLQQSL
jgi:hypothetical protein